MLTTVLRRLILAATASAAAVVIGAMTLGRPRIGAVLAFFVHPIPTMQDGEQAAVVLAWICIVAVVVAIFGAALGDARQAARRRATAVFPVMCVLVGGLLLALALVHRAVPATSLCCAPSRADVNEVIQLAR